MSRSSRASGTQDGVSYQTGRHSDSIGYRDGGEEMWRLGHWISGGSHSFGPLLRSSGVCKAWIITFSVLKRQERERLRWSGRFSFFTSTPELQQCQIRFVYIGKATHKHESVNRVNERGSASRRSVDLHKVDVQSIAPWCQSAVQQPAQTPLLFDFITPIRCGVFS